MIAAPARFATLRPTRSRGKPMLALPAPAAPAPPAPRGDGGEDLRFFLGCYAAGLIFFLVMLS